MGHPSYILSQLERKADEHEEVLRRIPAIQDVQSAWSLLLYCAVPRASYWSRTVQPELTAAFAERHDKDVWTCLCEILQINMVGPKVVSSASLPVTLGGVGLGSAVRIREASFWASWADCLKMVTERHPSIATAMIEGITQKSQGCMGSVARSGEALQKIGREVPSWMELSEGSDQTTKGPRKETPQNHSTGGRKWRRLQSTSIFVRQLCGPVESHRTGTSPFSKWPASFRPVDSIAGPPRLQDGFQTLPSGPLAPSPLAHSPFLSAVVVVAAYLTPMAITEQRVRQSGS